MISVASDLKPSGIPGFSLFTKKEKMRRAIITLGPGLYDTCHKTQIPRYYQDKTKVRIHKRRKPGYPKSKQKKNVMGPHPIRVLCALLSPVVYFHSPLLLELEPHHANQQDTKSSNEREQDQYIPIVTAGVESKELVASKFVTTNNVECECRTRTNSMINSAEILIGTPWSSSTIISPEPTSFTESASRVN